MKTCSFTGHRPTGFSFKNNETHPDCIKLKRMLKEQIAELCSLGVRDFYTGCALGTDMWAGEIVLELMKERRELMLHCVIPFWGQEKGWTAPQKERYSALLRAANEVDILSQSYSDDCYHARNRRLVENGDVILAVYNRNKSKGGGTRYTVTYAGRCGKPVIIIDPELFTVYNPFDEFMLDKALSI